MIKGNTKGYQTVDEFLKEGGKITYIENTPENIWRSVENFTFGRNHLREKPKSFGKYNLLKMESQRTKRSIYNYFEKNPNATVKEAAARLGIATSTIYRYRQLSYKEGLI